ncbi:ribonuclease H1 [Amylocarpus encephaloides]|uniref:ribonuclease H n=1 Tax=Amylocarpus encephaloides TaxID=45428 RepID=A0A9P7YIK4_9HELO|nr:ribonuclease H1 [Amylocarpus encephaloides]
MVYKMGIYVDGGCRNNGYSNAIGAAAACFMLRFGNRGEIYARTLPPLEKYNNLDTNPYIYLTIYSDSRYAVGCMNEWIYRWSKNGWVNAAGNEVANRDLIEKVSDLDDRLKEEGDVTYVWVPRGENMDADEACNEMLNKASRKYDSDGSDSY